jgi:hypothetical protein
MSTNLLLVCPDTTKGVVMTTYTGELLRYLSTNYVSGPYRLPPGLKKELEGFSGTSTSEMETYSPQQFDEILSKALKLAEESVSAYPVHYHTIEHFREVLAHGTAIITAYTHLSHKKLPPVVEQAFYLALALHDIGHPGATFRSDAPRGIQLPHFGTEVSTEWVSSVLADAFAKENGFNPFARLFITQIIWASTYGGTTPRGKLLKLDRIKPSTFFEHTMVVADIAPADSFVREMQKGVNVTFGEKPASSPPTTWSGWLKNRIGFLSGYILPNLSALDAVCDISLSTILGWRSAADHHLAKLTAIQAGKEPVLATIMKNQLAPYDDRIDLNA